MDRDVLIQEFKRATEVLLDNFHAVEETRFTQKPTADIWSVGQVAEHLMRLEGLTAKVLRGATVDAERDPEKRVGIIRKSFESTTRKYTAIGPIVPDDDPMDREALLTRFEQGRTEILGSLTDLPLEPLCTDFKHGIFGELTRGEWGWFVLLHGERHRGQVHRILEALQR